MNVLQRTSTSNGSLLICRVQVWSSVSGRWSARKHCGHVDLTFASLNLHILVVISSSGFHFRWKTPNISKLQALCAVSLLTSWLSCDLWTLLTSFSLKHVVEYKTTKTKWNSTKGEVTSDSSVKSSPVNVSEVLVRAKVGLQDQLKPSDPSSHHNLFTIISSDVNIKMSLCW